MSVQLTRVQRLWGDAHMYDFDQLTQKQQDVITYLVESLSAEDLAIMLIQHMTDDELYELEREVAESYVIAPMTDRENE